MNVFEEEARPWRELLNGWVWSSCGPARAILVSHSATGSVLASTRRGRAGGAADTSTAHALAAAQRHVLKLDKYGGDEVDSWVMLEASAQRVLWWIGGRWQHKR